MSLHADVRVYDPTGVTLIGTIAAEDMTSLRATDEVGAGGGISFSVPTPLLASGIPAALNDCVLKVWIQRTTGSAEDMIFAVRSGHYGSVKRTLTAGKETTDVDGVAVLPVWGADAVIRPEYGGADMPRAAGDERGFGWMMSAYDPADDPTVWGTPVETARTYLPSDPVDFPATTGAVWINPPGSGAVDGYRKLARAWLVVAEEKLYRIWFSHDDRATVWVAGEPVIVTADEEIGKTKTNRADVILQPGTYAIAVDFLGSRWLGDPVAPKDGIDPMILAVEDVDLGTYPLVTNATDWVAVRVQISDSGSQAPGPTAGTIIEQLVTEAATRGVDVWENVTTDFTATIDSDGVAWAATEERVQRYGFDTYANLFDGLGDNQCDMRLLPDLTLQARVFEGTDKTATVRIVHGGVDSAQSGTVEDESEQSSAVRSTVADALTRDGWVTRTAAGPRREVALSLGTAPSLSQGERITDRMLEDFATTRIDGDIRFIAEPGIEPYIDFRPGDTVTIGRASGDVERRILSLSLTGGKPLRWAAELGDAFL